MSNNSKLYKASDSNFNSKFDISQSKLNKNSDSNSTLDIPQSKLLIIGLDSFTGLHFSNYIEGKFEIFGTVFNPDFFLQRENIENYKNKYENKIFKCDITKKDEIKNILTKINPDFIIHLAGLSFVDLKNSLPFYNVNVIGVQNLLESIVELNQKPEKIIIPSSATVYGKNAIGVVSEKIVPEPVNHYGISKLAMEKIAATYFDKLNIIITRPFNYTGVGQAEKFLIPKIVKHFKEKEKEIELGNLNVVREFNDIEFVCDCYFRLLVSNCKSEIVNICSGNGLRLLDIINIMNQLAGYEIKIRINPEFVRKNEVKELIGDNNKLKSFLPNLNFKKYSITKTLENIYKSK